MSCIDDEWASFLTTQSSGQRFGNMPTSTKGGATPSEKHDPEKVTLKIKPITVVTEDCPSNQPVCEELYISTKTKVLFLNQPIDIHTVFWKIPINEYWRPIDGVVKNR